MKKMTRRVQLQVRSMSKQLKPIRETVNPVVLCGMQSSVRPNKATPFRANKVSFITEEREVASPPLSPQTVFVLLQFGHGGGAVNVCGLGFKINMTQNFGKDKGGK